MTLDNARKIIAKGVRSSDLQMFMRMYEAMLRINRWTNYDVRKREVARVQALLTDGPPRPSQVT
jgi:hypothetical protein